jgi:hypothetical protein
MNLRIVHLVIGCDLKTQGKFIIIMLKIQGILCVLWAIPAGRLDAVDG